MLKTGVRRRRRQRFVLLLLLQLLLMMMMMSVRGLIQPDDLSPWRVHVSYDV